MDNSEILSNSIVVSVLARDSRSLETRLKFSRRSNLETSSRSSFGRGCDLEGSCKTREFSRGRIKRICERKLPRKGIHKRKFQDRKSCKARDERKKEQENLRKESCKIGEFTKESFKIRKVAGQGIRKQGYERNKAIYNYYYFQSRNYNYDILFQQRRDTTILFRADVTLSNSEFQFHIEIA